MTPGTMLGQWEVFNSIHLVTLTLVIACTKLGLDSHTFREFLGMYETRRLTWRNFNRRPHTIKGMYTRVVRPTHQNTYVSPKKSNLAKINGGLE